ncbi:glycosyltransferase family 2 protein [Alicyclobacillus macrosporangiidus]|uniref:glycosyltransferase family 2 protein n=1 Tax=Alicyclobacillus macrosporangiidus TaxID=392015 RepID=UPI0026EF769D|nr:glycosyltransferase family 2 protein [Alicyclobacillus macrosporangiidus]
MFQELKRTKAHIPDFYTYISNSTPALSEVLLEQEKITAEQLKLAYAYQSKFGGNLKHILLRLGFISAYDTAHAAVNQQRTPLGKLLVKNGFLTPEQLTKALAIQQRSGGRLGDILIAHNYTTPRVLYRVLAEQLQSQRLMHPPASGSVQSPTQAADPPPATGSVHPASAHGKPAAAGQEDFSLEAARLLPEPLARRYNAVLLQVHEHDCTMAVTDLLSDRDLDDIRHLFGPASRQVHQVLATPYEMEQLWRLVYSKELQYESVERLAAEQPDNSAARVVTRRQVVFALALLILLVAALIGSPKWTMTVLVTSCQLLYCALALFKVRILYQGARRGAVVDIADEEVAQVDERTLPVYTLLVPLYKEARVLPDLVAHIEALDYPKHKLDVRLLFEADDVETLRAAQALRLPYNYTFVVVPDSLPKTKPKACNYGLVRARGQYVVIYDAEDRPEPDQLKKAVLAFRRLPEAYACVQARLNYFNSEQNLLTRWFTQEYSHWFGLLLPGLMTMDIPLPLGGTSNHFKTDVLRHIGAWDPYNVTEDADLGIRLYKLGYKTAVINSTTWEEANSQVGNWLRQRSRWIKGYLQTWLVHMRRPLRLLQELGWKGFLGFQAMILGTPLLPLMNPVFWGLTGLWFATHAKWIILLFPGPIYYISLLLLVVGNFYFVYSNCIGMYLAAEAYGERLPFGLVHSAVLAPCYWVLMSLAAYRALYQLMRNPFYWEKTQHGLVSYVPSTQTFPLGVSGSQSASV